MLCKFLPEKAGAPHPSPLPEGRAALNEAALRRHSRGERGHVKELVKNKLPISCAFGNGSVVPLGQVIVKEYLHIVFEISGVLPPGLVRLVEASHRHT